MAKITQHRPSYFSGFEIQTFDFNSIEELLEIHFVKNFNAEFNSKFFQYSYSEYSDEPTKKFVLLAEYNEGKEWWVIGYVDDNEIIKTLPKWEKE